MNTLDEHIKRLSEKLQLLLKKYQTLEKENEKLKHDLQQKIMQEKEMQEKAGLLQQQIEIAKLSAVQPDPETKQELEKRINTYVKEIDQCIAMLSNQ